MYQMYIPARTLFSAGILNDLRNGFGSAVVY